MVVICNHKHNTLDANCGLKSFVHSFLIGLLHVNERAGWISWKVLTVSHAELLCACVRSQGFSKCILLNLGVTASEGNHFPFCEHHHGSPLMLLQDLNKNIFLLMMENFSVRKSLVYIHATPFFYSYSFLFPNQRLQRYHVPALTI